MKNIPLICKDYSFEKFATTNKCLSLDHFKDYKNVQPVGVVITKYNGKEYRVIWYVGPGDPSSPRTIVFFEPPYKEERQKLIEIDVMKIASLIKRLIKFSTRCFRVLGF